MNIYKNRLSAVEDNAHLISMVPVEELLRFGYEIGLNNNTKVLDLCCGYGTLLKVWSEAFDIKGIGVDQNEEFLTIGRGRLKQANVENTALICGDVTAYKDDDKYDVVVCSETIGSIKNTLELGEKFLKKGGVLAYQKLYSKVPNPPRELIDFDGEGLPLSQLNSVFNELGLYITAMASDTDSMWEHYVINWSSRRGLYKLREDLTDKTKQQIRKWYDMYFNYRRKYEGQALFALERI